jgi:hypothetical protein
VSNSSWKSLEKYMPPAERLEVSTLYSTELNSSSLRILTGILILKRGVALRLAYINPLEAGISL